MDRVVRVCALLVVAVPLTGWFLLTLIAPSLNFSFQSQSTELTWHSIYLPNPIAITTGSITATPTKSPKATPKSSFWYTAGPKTAPRSGTTTWRRLFSRAEVKKSSRWITAAWPPRSILWQWNSRLESVSWKSFQSWSKLPTVVLRRHRRRFHSEPDQKRRSSRARARLWTLARRSDRRVRGTVLLQEYLETFTQNNSPRSGWTTLYGSSWRREIGRERRRDRLRHPHGPREIWVPASLRYRWRFSEWRGRYPAGVSRLGPKGHL